MSSSCLQNKVQSPQMALHKITFVCPFTSIFLLLCPASCSVMQACIEYNRLPRPLTFRWVSPTGSTGKRLEERRRVRLARLLSWLPPCDCICPLKVTAPLRGAFSTCTSYYCCAPNHSKIWCHKNKHFVLFMDSVGQDAGQGTVGMGSVCSTSGTSAKDI